MPEGFVASLASYRSQGVFNPWGERDPQHDLPGDTPGIRRRQLVHYLCERVGRADTLLLAEAIGYQGGHFSGIPMTSERLLLGGLKGKGISPRMVFQKLAPERTSRPELRQAGFTEPTATIVWGAFIEQGLDPRSVVLWNAFPWHPYQTDKGMLSNRTPNDRELADGHQVLRQLLKLGQFRQIVAVGEKSAQQLAGIGVTATKVRHPANGGAGLFRRQLQALLEKNR